MFGARVELIEKMYGTLVLRRNISDKKGSLHSYDEIHIKRADSIFLQTFQKV